MKIDNTSIFIVIFAIICVLYTMYFFEHKIKK